ncbi:putative Sperm tail PG rich repeat [Trypanosoma vivax]|uniref:Sperm-tail PG-rich repeat n=1 Tax=Trypanosoma vivax (strain Y486) TaxID=1055687 RepID=G0U337_TRYVY|nr:hypothetical protein TRVL_03588 [Trypanosoma vivax]KAH8604325.1 putative Sperm tail PG rich repeat [Trypanosoma vivax]CCC50692.1 conserved hypothetical protein [Trypanosoma vivax Y486]
MTRIHGELPLFRAKVPELGTGSGTGQNIGPGSYDLKFGGTGCAYSIPPFGSGSDRFPVNKTATTPGVGAYELPMSISKKSGLSIVPFNSRVSRFYERRDEGVPGPGAYTPCENQVRRNRRAQTMGCSRNGSMFERETLGPGCYNPIFSKTSRVRSGAVNFDDYCSRKSAPQNDNPGPGCYECPGTGKTIYSRKPTSSFASKTERSTFTANASNPGPGTYDLPSCFESKSHYQAANPEAFSVFGSTAARYGPYGPNPYPGPGAYTGEIAPRRIHVNCDDKGTSSFMTGSGRTTEPQRTNLGPGTYDDVKLTREPAYQMASVPFRSNVERFPSPKVEQQEIVAPRRTVLRVPRRVHPVRLRNNGVDGDAHSRQMELSLPMYDADYSYTKPRCNTGGFIGLEPRFARQNTKSTAPPPGCYNTPENPVLGGAHSLRGTFGTDGRFKSVVDDTLGPGSYWPGSSFLRKSFNQTFNQTQVM